MNRSTDPPDLALLCDQAAAHHRAGRLEAAEPLYQQILAADAAHFPARHLLGALRHQQGRNDEAADLIAAALATNAEVPEAQSNYGAVLKALGRLDDALAAYDKAVALKPAFADAWVGRGAVLSDLNRFADALASYNHALDLKPGDALALANRGLVQQYLGRLEEARADFVAALAADPSAANVYLDYADLAPMRADDPLLARMEALRAQVSSDKDRTFLDFALGKAHADLGDHPRSFGHFLSGNKLKRTGIVYDEAAVLGLFDAIAANFSASVLREKESLGAGASSEAPIFIIGMMRSGSTLVEQILASHPKVHGGGELPSFGRAAVAQMTFPQDAAALDAAALQRIAANYLQAVQVPGAARITDKMLTNYFFAGLIHLAFPNARIIHTARDPVDTCVSCFSKYFTAEQNHTYDLAELGRYYRRYQRLMAHWHAVLPPGRILDVRYEDVVADLEGQARRVVAHCGLNWDDKCLSFHTAARPVRTASVAQVRQPIYQTAMGRAQAYEEFLSPLRQALAEADLAR